MKLLNLLRNAIYTAVLTMNTYIQLSYQTNKLNFWLLTLPALCFKNILQVSFQDNPLAYKGKYQGVFDSSLNYV